MNLPAPEGAFRMSARGMEERPMPMKSGNADICVTFGGVIKSFTVFQ
jgi:hypothetical protein